MGLTGYDSWKLEGHDTSEDQALWEQYCEEFPEDQDGEGFEGWMEQNQLDRGVEYGDYLADLADARAEGWA